MNNAFYTGASGLRAHQTAIDITSHNLTNSNTYGYKATKPEFRELLNNNMDINKNRELGENEKILKGHGVKMSNQDLLFTQGAFYNTGYQLDYAIQGDGLFALDRGGEIEYTRNGSFGLSIEGENAYLVSGDGAYVLDHNYNRIAVPYNQGSNVINSQGLSDRLGVFTFSNPYDLTMQVFSRLIFQETLKMRLTAIIIYLNRRLSVQTWTWQRSLPTLSFHRKLTSFQQE